MADPIVQFRSVSRAFSELLAVNGVDLDILPGEVLALLGENGAGKSTLMKLLYGLHPPTAGAIAVDGAVQPIAGPADAMRLGIGMVFQNFSLLPALSVRDNLLLAWPETPFWKSHRNRATEKVLETLRDLAPGIAPGRAVRDLSVGEQQIVELCKVLNISARVVILDEPTSVLTPEEVDRLHAFIRQLSAKGVAVVLITHKLADVEACADRIAIMRRGRIVDVSQKGARSMEETVSLMMGLETDRSLRPPDLPEKPVPRLMIRDVSAEASGRRISDLALEVGRGEIVGIAGVAGNGQTLLAETLTGIHPVTSGDVLLDGISVARKDPRERLSTPIGYIPEQPRDNGIIASMSLAENLALRDLAAGRAATVSADVLLSRFAVNPPEPERLAGTLSGGNVQKLVSARELGVPRPAVVACYPTMGLDVKAIELIYSEIFRQASGGAAVVWISEDLDDLLAAAHRIVVMREGRFVADLANDGNLTRDLVGGLMTGMSEAAA